MAALAGLTTGIIVVLVEEEGQTIFTVIPQYWQLALFGLIIPFLIVGASMAINDYHDFEADRINKRMDRPLVRNPDLNPNNVLFLSLAMIVLGILVSFLLFLDNVLVTFGVSVISLLAISYSMWTKDMGFIGNLTVATCDTAPFILALIAMGAQEEETILVVLIMAALTFFGVTGRELIKGIMDIEGDKITNSQTFAVRYGPKRAVQLASFFFIIVIILAPFPLFVKFHNNYLYLVFMLITIALLLYTVILLYRDPSIEAGKKGRHYTRTALWCGAIAFLVGVFSV
ncbi:MAG: hypothetical protein EAX86_01545 [Candidatus Heimdallarchaeota archaeon]|nr:hypothetical protein [Candidatus Heimdallarchaeota archaeon]